MKKIAFYFALTPFHVYFFDLIDFADYDLVFVVNFSKKKIIRKAKNLKFLINAQTLIFRKIQMFLFVVFYFFYSRISADIFYPHIYDKYLNPYIFSNKTKCRFVIQDGIANFYDAKLSEKVKTIYKKRNKIFKLFNYPKFCEAKDFFYAEKVDAVYTFFPKFLTHNLCGKGRLPSLEQKNKIKRRLDGGVMILDQPLRASMSEEIKLKIFEKMARYLRENHCSIIYFKRHYAGTSQLYCYLQNQGLSLEYVDSDIVIEQYLQKIQVASVISFTSSALVNIKSFCRDMEVVAFVGSDQTLKRNGKEISYADFFKMFEVQVIEV